MSGQYEDQSPCDHPDVIGWDKKIWLAVLHRYDITIPVKVLLATLIYWHDRTPETIAEFFDKQHTVVFRPEYEHTDHVGQNGSSAEARPTTDHPITLLREHTFVTVSLMHCFCHARCQEHRSSSSTSDTAKAGGTQGRLFVETRLLI